MTRKKKKKKGYLAEKYKPDLVGITRYKGKKIANMVDEAAKLEGKSISAFQRDLVFDLLEKKFGNRFLDALEEDKTKYKKDRWKWIKRMRKKKGE